MLRSRAAAGLSLAPLIVAGCFLAPPQVVCKDVEPAVCQRVAEKVIADMRAQQPERRIVRLVIMDERGSYEFTLDNGSGGAMIVD